MAFDIPTFTKRAGSAVVFAVIMLAGLLWIKLAFLGLVLLVQVLCLGEYFKLAGKIGGRSIPAWLQWVIQLAGVYLLLHFYSAWLLEAMHGPVLWLISALSKGLPLLMMLPVILLLAATLAKQSWWVECTAAFAGVPYIALPCLLFAGIRQMDIVLPVTLVGCIWINDTMAYIVGSFIGKTPFSPISPKKTWEGTAGGAILTVAVACMVAYFWKGVSMQDAIALSLCAAIAGTAGDLLESKLKRMAGVKDSGNIMPGHGGALDRFDSLLVAIPFACCYLLISRAL